MALLGRTANGLFWMHRYIERAENMARLIDAGLRISLTNLSAGPEEWHSVLTSAGVEAGYRAKYAVFEPSSIIDFLLRDPDNPSSVVSSIDTARMNGRMVRTALTREVWEALNEGWIHLKRRLGRPVSETELPGVLDLVKRQTAYVRGAFHGTMLRNEIFDFANLGTFIERADNTARILDVKYWVLLPKHSSIGSPLDHFQWISILRSVSAHRAYTWEYGADFRAPDIIDFLVLNRRMPRSLAYSYGMIEESLGYLARTYGVEHECHQIARARTAQFSRCQSINDIIEGGLHEFLESFIIETNGLANEIARNYSFYPV
ncbi:alpha-E domain-containing protein [Aurantimonas sp. MSK8Z-1]|uniref:alpha-E domain-containing protein n=1 Tax=Mangrovibrevibacter kandeliae TaxID=2968473 RepID=UPI002118FBB8|nr:alpha-E domain-containing protein [Aurantimonas sp. MSK8Z-1]MCW4114063.1 alpha-E domain-containing protein [Aurantimonas sp. MSK8Z-1]